MLCTEYRGELLALNSKAYLMLVEARNTQDPKVRAALEAKLKQHIKQVNQNKLELEK